MGFLDDVFDVGTSIIQYGRGRADLPQYQNILPYSAPVTQPSLGAPTGVGEDYWGSGPGFDWMDIPDVLGRILTPWEQIGRGGYFPEGVPPQGGNGAPPEIGAGPVQGPVQPGTAQLRTTGAKTAMYIAGNCPGLWHTTAVRPLFDRHTGAFLRNVGGNRVSNRVSLVQDDSGALEFVSPVKATWSLKYKSRRSSRRSSTRSSKSYHRRSSRKRGHRHSLTRKQLAAGFGGKSHMRAH